MSERLVIKWHLSPNCDERLPDTDIRFLIIHYTACDFKTALDYLAGSLAPNRVSAHYLIDEDGTTVQLVHENRRAWHAGLSSWGEYQGLNTWSIGIELVNPGHEYGYRAFPEAQMASLIRLCHQILKRHPIRPEFILGHSDIAPMRKLDPGELFDWQRLASEGIGLYPSPSCKAPQQLGISYVQNLLSRFGYRLPVTGMMDEQTLAVLRAFQMHYCPFRVDQTIYPEMVARLETLCGELEYNEHGTCKQVRKFGL
jgi:N-acetylmuramoyl-L-alanine amidase